MENKEYDIDIVLTWVNGSDVKLLRKKSIFLGPDFNVDQTKERYRDWDNLQYLLRSIETNANWVRNIFLITDDQVPPWLNTNNKKLKVIDHTDYIPSKYLPTFNSNVIELNLHHIKDLSEHFLLFNDDMFLIDSTEPSDFFSNGSPLEYVKFKLYSASINNNYSNIVDNNIRIINDKFRKKDIVNNMDSKFIQNFNIKDSLTHLYSYIHPGFTGFDEIHVVSSHLKSKFKQVWDEYGVHLDEMCYNRVRKNNDFSHFFIKWWMISEGLSRYRDKNFGQYFSISESNYNQALTTIRKSNSKVICINDNENLNDFERIRDIVNAELEGKFPIKSSFEK